ncbi:hypothetical protein [Bogoriella caseilytica]|uniref:Uncharacterized protein n=1 Tax=Bogoriella caseilytica TaxID=56055 RepID=A0A3N2BH14_9MICO|nr:hypothetical protein [Bogoriella caseilytica]ROR74508.1 hypothetical protein EDD31_2926 [Bogoriella caseilytica]
MSEPPNRRDVPAPAFWREYPIGDVGEWARSWRRTLLAVVAGLAVVGVFALLAGWIGEERRAGFPDLDFLDQWIRQTMALVLLVGYLVVLLVCLAALIEEVASSRALARAADAGAPVHAVPHPGQLRLVVSDPGAGLTAFAVLNLAVAAIAVLGIAIVAWTDTFYDSMAVALAGILGYCLALIGALGAVGSRIRPAHRRRRERMAAHWPAEAEVAAWRRARGGGRAAAAAEGATGERQRIRWGGRLQYAGGAMLVAAYAALYVLLTVAYRRPPPRWWRLSAERHQYGEDVEYLLRTGFLLGAAAVVAGIVVIIVGLATNAAAHERERTRLRAALQDPSAPHPQFEVLHRHTERTPVPAASVVAMLGAMVLISTGGLWRAEPEGAGAGTALMVCSAVGAIMVAALWQWRGGRRGRELRNDLRARWPVPPPPERSGGAPVPATVGPVLHPDAGLDGDATGSGDAPSARG